MEMCGLRLLARRAMSMAASRGLFRRISSGTGAQCQHVLVRLFGVDVLGDLDMSSIVRFVKRGLARARYENLKRRRGDPARRGRA